MSDSSPSGLSPYEPPKNSPVYSAYRIACDRAYNQQSHLLGRFLTFFDSLFDEGPRLKAVKDTFSTIYWEGMGDQSTQRASVFASLAREIGDRECEFFLKEVHPNIYLENLMLLTPKHLADGSANTELGTKVKKNK